MVTEVLAGMPAQAAGLRDGDLIVSFGGSPIERTDDLHCLLNGDRVGTPNPLQVLRGVELIHMTITPAERATG